ncbi:hypothetical protein PbDSM24746_52970 [Paenibacillus macerans]|uniref:radical SAM protein n=1 Tax=Paenibacillus macerans TaxID=44252 RepID=UPI000EC22395|nr:radical SAM protein [Paenibacillus macerans]GBK65293.1 hypothetical protein PbDSM24746_52970 [Paenibacillus macerans]GBK71530.1 hypothetical protein PbJCM17693_52380 [Paenibacillus macerans]
MLTTRPLYVNNSLSTGICNYNCILCGINKPNYNGPKKFQDEETTNLLISRILQAAAKGVKFRLIANSGSGEPTLHPHFDEKMNEFGNMLENWPSNNELTPEISIVTNGSRLLETRIVEALINNPITVNVSFPTSDVKRYSKVMFGENNKNSIFFEKVVKGIRELLNLYSEGKINKVCFHISPPLADMTNFELSNTLSFLCEIASKSNVSSINVIMFPIISNRSGLIDCKLNQNDSYENFISEFDGKIYSGVKVRIENVWNRFFKEKKEIEEMINVFKHPCIWNSNIFLTAYGDSVCCNDQEITCNLGNINSDDFETLMLKKENSVVSEVCKSCNQRYAQNISVDELISEFKLKF